MENALLVTTSEKDSVFFSGFLKAASINQIISLQSCESAGELVQKQDFDLIIVDSFPDKSGLNFCRQEAAKGVSQIILMVDSDAFDQVSAACEEDGILVIVKPVDKYLLWSALSLVKSVHNRVKQVQAENTYLKQNIEDIRIINRAKLILISNMQMNENEAHRYIEKQAMNMRTSRRIIAEGILKRYEN